VAHVVFHLPDQRRVGGVPGPAPHADRDAVPGDRHADHDLGQVVAVVLGLAEGAEPRGPAVLRVLAADRGVGLLGLSIPAFLRDAGILYMIAEAVSEEAPVAPLFAAMATEVHYVAAQTGQASPSGRLDPPLLMGLDEVTQICPVPLPSWLSDSGGKGIQVVAVVHGEAQLTGRWGDHGRQVVLDTSWPDGSPASPKATATPACTGPPTAPWTPTRPPT
jgi:TraM recognition site of TraD and TraG